MDSSAFVQCLTTDTPSVSLSSSRLTQDKFPFKCHFCPAKYGTHKTLKTHISTNHKDHLKQPGEKKSQVVWTPSDSEDLSSEEIDVGSDQNWLPDCGHPTIQQAMLNGEEEGTSSSASGTQGESDLYDMNESGQETSEGGGEESVRSGEGEVWRQGEVADPLVAEDLVTDTVSWSGVLCVCVCVCVHACVHASVHLHCSEVVCLKSLCVYFRDGTM